MSTSLKILIGRFLTRAGDQAWDFAVPLVLIKIFPNQIQIAAGYFLAVKLLHVLLMPRIATVIDRRNRLHVAYFGSVMQLVGVLAGAIALISLYNSHHGNTSSVSSGALILFMVLGISGLICSLGSSLMNISVGNDLAPSAIAKTHLSKFNSRMRQLDLFTEVTAPVLAGLLLLIEWPGIPLAGFLLIAVWNLISFVPEIFILRSIFKSHPELLSKEALSAANQKSLAFKLKNGWASFFRQPVAPAVLAYALLWLSVLSPHGILLTGYLKDGMKLSEVVIGAFRGLGALFGLMATVLYPIIIAKFGLLKGSRAFIIFQTFMLLMALIFFWLPMNLSQYGFLACILFSRVGLYGFSLGEMQIRQLGIAPHERGEVNGFADALTGVATLALYGFGTLLPSTSEFSILIVGSVFFVTLGAFVFSLWKPKISFEA